MPGHARRHPRGGFSRCMISYDIKYIILCMIINICACNPCLHTPLNIRVSPRRRRPARAPVCGPRAANSAEKWAGKNSAELGRKKILAKSAEELFRRTRPKNAPKRSGKRPPLPAREANSPGVSPGGEEAQRSGSPGVEAGPGPPGPEGGVVGGRAQGHGTGPRARAGHGGQSLRPPRTECARLAQK